MYDGFLLTCSTLSRRGAELNDVELCREGPLLRELPNPENNDLPDELEDDRLWELGPDELLLPELPNPENSDPPDELEDDRLWEPGPNELLLPKELELRLLLKLLDELRLLLRELLEELRLLLELLL